jgi:dihydrofolate reductase
MKISLIVAMSTNRVIGRAGELPWRLSADLRRFKRLTMGHAIIMGRRTFESIGRALPGRRSIVVSRQRGFSADGVQVATSPEEALRMVGEDSEVFFIGGAEIYRQALPLAGRLYLTRVNANVPGDTYFPPLDLSNWRLVEASHHAADDKNEFDHSFLVFERSSTVKCESQLRPR